MPHWLVYLTCIGTAALLTVGVGLAARESLHAIRLRRDGFEATAFGALALAAALAAILTLFGMLPLGLDIAGLGR